MGDPRPIGIFDSGVGGLTVTREIRRLLPNESTIYVGDTANVPYGTKTPAELLLYAREIINFLLSENVKAIVIACGTSGAVTYTKFLDEFPKLPLFDVIRPGVNAARHAIKDTENFRLGVIATEATIKNGLFSRLLAEKYPRVKISAVACPLFASMVEAGLPPNHPAVIFAAETYLSHLRGQIDALVLGCTHYPLLTEALTPIFGGIKFIDISEAAAQAAKQRLFQLNILSDGKAPTFHKFYVTGPAEVFRATGSLILGEKCEPVSIVL
jgi:glutamate racemase